MKNRFTVLLFSLLLLFSSSILIEQVEAQVVVDPSVQYQEVEGWGGSLCWWANIMGGYSDIDVLKVCDWVTDPDGLNMNIFRFNIGGGDDPSHHHMRGDGGAMPGYKASASDAYDWTQDENQRKILQQLIASRVEQTGSNDIILEAFSNSPPFWMTKSGCSSGSVQGNVSNLKDDMYDDFAEYLTDVVAYYHDELGVTFDYLEPFNEPYSTWWKALGGQEGCYFAQADQEKMIRELYTVMERKNMFEYCTITAMDANSLSESINGVNQYYSEGDILSKLTKINAHSYFGNDNNRKSLASFSHNKDIKLWQSESGPLSTKGTSEELIILMAQRIVTDMKLMKCPAWIDWQIAADDSPQWGILVGKYGEAGHPVTKGYAYPVRTQFSRFIKVGYTIIDVKDENTLAALSPDQSELVLVVVNMDDGDVDHSYDLGAFNVSESGARYRTRVVNSSYTEKVAKSSVSIEDNALLEYTAPKQSVSTFVFPVAIADEQISDGTYYILNKAADKYVGISASSNSAGAQLEITGENPNPNSIFHLSMDALNGGFSMKPGHLGGSSNYVLNVEGTNGADGAKIIQYSDWNGENQRFHFIHLTDEYYKIVIRSSMKTWSIPGSDFSEGENVVQMAWDGLDNSIWQIRKNLVSVLDEPTLKPMKIYYYSGQLNVRANEENILRNIYVLDLLGKVLDTRTNIQSNTCILSLDYQPGIYLVHAMLDDGFTHSEPFYIN